MPTTGHPYSHYNFYPRSPCGERQNNGTMMISDVIFLSTLSLRRATAGYRQALAHCNISIHALLAESDGYYYLWVLAYCTFLSTLSLRRATPRQQPRPTRPCNFYPRSPCGERRFWNVVPLIARYFYPRSPCGERPRPKRVHSSASKFLSTLSLRRATLGAIGALIDLIFLSTLSLRRATSASKCR